VASNLQNRLSRRFLPFPRGQAQQPGDSYSDPQSDESRAQDEDTLGGALCHPEYRALVVRAAGKNPSTKALYLAQSKVDAALGRAGTSIQIPGASPGRRTI
jgi:hypothetical protein